MWAAYVRVFQFLAVPATLGNYETIYAYAVCLYIAHCYLVPYIGTWANVHVIIGAHDYYDNTVLQ